MRPEKNAITRQLHQGPGGQGISQLLFAASCTRGRTTPCFPGQISSAVGAWRGLHRRAALVSAMIVNGDPPRNQIWQEKISGIGIWNQVKVRKASD